jgi:hypothetical protein
MRAAIGGADVGQNALVAIVSGARSGMRWSHVQVFVLRQ